MCFERVAHLGPRKPLPEIIPLGKKSIIFLGKFTDTGWLYYGTKPPTMLFIIQRSVNFFYMVPKAEPTIEITF